MKKVALLVVLLLLGISLRAEEEITLMTEIFPPHQFYRKDLKLTGISMEIIEAVKKEINSQDPIKEVPWTRGVKIKKKKKNSALFSTLRTPDREKLYKCVGPLVDLSVVFFKKAGSNIVLKSMEDVRKVGKIGVTRNAANYELLAAKGFENLDVRSKNLTVGDIEKKFIQILSIADARNDLWLTERVAFMGRLGRDQKLVELTQSLL